MTIALRLSRNARFLFIALTLMFASCAVYRLRAVSYAAPTSLETAGTDRTDYDAGVTVFVRGSGYEPSTAVRVRVIRPDGSVATEVASRPTGSSVEACRRARRPALQAVSGGRGTS